MNETCILISSQNVSQNCLIIRNIQPVDTANVKRSGVKHWLLLSEWSEILITKWFSKIPQNFRDKLFIVYGQTESGMGMMILTVALSNFVMSL